MTKDSASFSHSIHDFSPKTHAISAFSTRKRE
jgi:hypothetical protein